jgi:CRP/FNR family cyclic AMP-dependent transcriptional regulator
MTELEWLEGNGGLDQAGVQSPFHSLLKEVHAAKPIIVSRLHPRGSLLFSEGQPARGVYVLRAGRAKVSISSSAGKVLLLKIARAGDLLGLNSTLGDSCYEATVQALDSCLTDFISQADFMDLLNRSNEARIAVSAALSKELTETSERVRQLFLPRSTREKLARLLIKWCDELGDAGPNEIRINSGLTQEEIAQMICSTRETVTRLFAEFKRKRILTLADNSIIVRNRKALEMLAC